MDIGNSRSEWHEVVRSKKELVGEEIVQSLLGELNWRTRKVGTYFAAIMNYKRFISDIGIHLVKSEVCCVGDLYATVLAYFNTPVGKKFLIEYLDYCMTRPDLWYDQQSVLNCVKYLDMINGTEDGHHYREVFNQMQIDRKRFQIDSAKQSIPVAKAANPTLNVEEILTMLENQKVVLYDDLDPMVIGRQVDVMRLLSDFR